MKESIISLLSVYATLNNKYHVKQKVKTNRHHSIGVVQQIHPFHQQNNKIIIALFLFGLTIFGGD